ncbi:MAG: glycoside hydrolase family 15 protein [Actinomycetota bacterium]|nr:glycoside hydrolase family 15 protein [Actinomycetota bacterium]
MKVRPVPPESYPPIADYGFISDCHSAALVSRAGAIDWCCLPRFDSPSVFGRLLDWNEGGSCCISPAAEFTATRRYLDRTLVLETTFVTASGRARLLDFMSMRPGGRSKPHRQLVRVVEGLEGRVELDMTISPRFDYGSIRPWIRHQGDGGFAALGGAAALSLWSDADLSLAELHDLEGRVVLAAGERVRLSLQFVRPESLDGPAPSPPTAEKLDARLDGTVAWWRDWARQSRAQDPLTQEALGSALVLKGLTHAPTGAIVAAPTTSLPETPGGERNWDYRFSWIRDSAFTLRSLHELGFVKEADGFARFVERSAAGSVSELQIMYGCGGEHRLTELLLDLHGYRGARPVRIGNAAYQQSQHDVYGVLLEVAARRYGGGETVPRDYWRFLAQLVQRASEIWKEPDQSIWEVRSEPLHFVQSKVMCWVAVDRGISLAERALLPGDLKAWKRARSEIRDAVETHGYDSERGVFVRAFGSTDMDAALLLLPEYGFLEWRDERMVRTTDAIMAELGSDGLLLRYIARDGLEGAEGHFLCCSFWLVECLARQGRVTEARAVFERTRSSANDLGLFPEELDVGTGEMLGNFPQGLSHLAHIQAALALAECE